MAADMFSQRNAQTLLSDKRILIVGDSNTRALYKDLVWLLEYGSLIPDSVLKMKNEACFANDMRLSSGLCMNSCAYEEVRLYSRRTFYVKFQFLTRVFQDRFTDMISELRQPPSVIVINSCLWDISRYGPNSIENFQKNVKKILEFFKKYLPFVKIIWTTALPPSPKCRGGFLNDEAKLTQSLLPFHVVQANEYIVNTVQEYGVDVLDLHYHMKFLIDFRTPDGIHWQPIPVRYMTNLLLTHISISQCHTLPMNVRLHGAYAYNYECGQLANRKILSHNNNLFKRKNQSRKNNFRNKRIQSRRGLKNYEHYINSIDFTSDTKI